MTNTNASPNLSYDHGVSRQKLIGETIGVFFDRQVEAHRERLALVVRHQDVRWTWGEFGARVDALAAGLLALGLEPGDRIGMWSPNNAEWATTQFATAKAGLVLVNVNQRFPFGGTSILIMVGVALDTVKQIESQLQQRNYEGFLR